MKKTSKIDKSRTKQLVGLIFFLIGFTLLFFPFAGTLIGVVMMVGSFSAGYTKMKIWKCNNCETFLERI
jgi:hypothetical protein